jgi:hypothetical protein
MHYASFSKKAGFSRFELVVDFRGGERSYIIRIG